jgi:hypothetical protein
MAQLLSIFIPMTLTHVVVEVPMSAYGIKTSSVGSISGEVEYKSGWYGENNKPSQKIIEDLVKAINKHKKGGRYKLQTIDWAVFAPFYGMEIGIKPIYKGWNRALW